jgi:hypothetical protein
MTCLDKKRLVEKINILGATEHMEILRIINQNNVPMTENKNGFFFNLSTIDDDTYTIISDFVNYCCENKSELDEYDQKLHECKFFSKPKCMSYGVMEPKNKNNDIQKVIDEKIDDPDKITGFVARLYGGTEKSLLNKRSTGKFLMFKKKFSKNTQQNDGLLDILTQD